MALKNFVKINQVSSLSDARYCAGMGVDILGFTLIEDSPSYVDPEQFKEITQWVAGPKFAGEFGQADLETIKLATVDYKLDLIETSIPGHLESLASLEIPVIYRAKLGGPQDMEHLQKAIAYGADLLSFLHVEYSTDAFSDFDQLPTDQGMKLILNIPAPLENLDRISKHGLSLTAQTEAKTGLQDYGEIMDVLEALELEI